MKKNRFYQLLESSLGNVKPLLMESLDSGCLRSAGFTRESIGGPMTRRMVYEKTKNGVTYQIGITGNDTPSSELKMIKNGTSQYCSWTCDSASPIGIKYSGCKVEERPLNEEEMDESVIITNEDYPFPDDPNDFGKFEVEEIFNVASSVDEANEMIKDIYPGYYFNADFETPDGKTINFYTPDGEKITGKYIVGCCGGMGSTENLDRFSRSDDAFFNPNKKY